MILLDREIFFCIVNMGGKLFEHKSKFINVHVFNDISAPNTARKWPSVWIVKLWCYMKSKRRE